MAGVKLSLNQLIALVTNAFVLSLGFVQQAANIEIFAFIFDKTLQKMLDRNYVNPNFLIKHLIKDINLFLTEADSAGLNSSL